MSEVTSVSQLTIADVIDPNKSFTASVLGAALKTKSDKAAAALQGLAGTVLDRVGCEAAKLAQEKKELEAALAVNAKATAKLDAHVAHTQATNNVFSLAAHVGMKSAATQFAASNGLVVPANTDPIWSLPE